MASTFLLLPEAKDLYTALVVLKELIFSLWKNEDVKTPFFSYCFNPTESGGVILHYCKTVYYTENLRFS